MSNPLKRRMAKAALLLAAGAAPVLGSAGAASAVSLPPATDLGGMTTLDAVPVEDTVQGAAGAVNSMAGETGGEVVQELMPAVGTVVGTLTEVATPLALEAGGVLMGGSDTVAGKTMSALGETGVPGGLPTGDMPVTLVG